jgi:DNA-binding NtrC family response regulator
MGHFTPDIGAAVPARHAYRLRPLRGLPGTTPPAEAGAAVPVLRQRAPHQDIRSAALVGTSRIIADIRAEIETIAGSAASVLITGPSGSGKDVVAQLLHQRSHRATAPFVALNCAAVARDLLESEMFGHEAGAFTGALKARAGRFEAAQGGTLFLDEVGDMPLAMQAKLLRALETRIVERVGGMLPIAVDVRLVAATSVDLIAAIDRGSFRADLLYRLDVIRIEMPPLADRIEDVPVLIDHFLARQPGLPVRFSGGAMAGLMRYRWPGNVRELKNVVDRAQAHFAGQTIEATALPKLLRPAQPLSQRALGSPPAAATGAAAEPRIDLAGGVDLKRILADLETAYITEALATSHGAVAATAKLLGLQRTTLIEKMRRLGIHAA